MCLFQGLLLDRKRPLPYAEDHKLSPVLPRDGLLHD